MSLLHSEISNDNTNWVTSLVVAQADAESAGQMIYARFSPTIENDQIFNHIISHTSINATTVNISVSGMESTFSIDDILSVISGVDGQEFTIEGVVTTPDYGSTNGQYFLQDATGGINIFHLNNQGLVTLGDEVRITGTRATFNNMIELEPTSVQVLSNSNTIPDHEVITESDVSVNSSFLGQLVRIGGVTLTDGLNEWPTTSNPSGTNVNATVGATSFLLRIDDVSFYDGTPAPSGTLIVSGILTRFAEDIQIMPFFDGDIVESSANPPVLEVNPTSVDFSEVIINTKSESILLNVSGSDLTETVTINVTGEFEVSEVENGSFNSSLNLSVPEGSLNQNIYVRFSPTSLGEKDGGINMISSGEDETVSLFGVAVEEVVPAPELNLSVNSIDFGEVAIGESNIERYSLSASNLTADLIITPPAQITLSLVEEFNSSVFTNNSPLIIGASSGSIEVTDIYVRFAPSVDDQSSLMDNILHASNGISENILVSGSKLEEPVIPDAWINEFHYANAGDDQNEFVEILINDAADFNLADFTIELVNEDGTIYSSFLGSSMTGQILETYGLYFRNFGGIKNGPNGIRLIYNTEVLDYISYGGVIPGATFINVEEGNNTNEKTSIQLCCSGDSQVEMNWLGGLIASPGYPNENMPLGVKDEQVWFYPNPVSDRIFLNFEGPYIEASISNLLGQEIIKSSGSKKMIEEELNKAIRSFRNGVYLLVMSYGAGEKYTSKITIAH